VGRKEASESGDGYGRQLHFATMPMLGREKHALSSRKKAPRVQTIGLRALWQIHILVAAIGLQGEKFDFNIQAIKCTLKVIPFLGQPRQ
jgi:hypothetical protein